MNFKKIMATLLAGVMAVGMSAAAITLDTAETAEETVIADAVLAGESTVSMWDGTATTEWYTSNPDATEFYINSASDLAGLAQLVNSNTRTDWQPFYMTTIYLTTDIDLNQIEWTPIGTTAADKTGFYGNFDGQGHTISNLWISEWTKDRAGLFGYTHVNTEGPHQQFKNFTVNNATVVSSKDYVAAIAASTIVSDFENVHLTGDITIQGNKYVGGIVGHGYGYWNKCSVKAEGTINSTYWCCASIVGYMGEGSSAENCTVTGTGEGIELWSAMAGIGGAFGMPAGDCTFNNITVSNVDLSTNPGYASYGVGYIAGCYMNPASNITNSIYSNVTANCTVQDTAVVTSAVAEVNGVYYTDIVEAFKAVNATNNVVNFLADVTYTDKWDCRYTGSKFMVPVTINGNGHTFKLTGMIDDKNWNTVFRFEDVATVNNLTIDVSEATGAQRVISSKLSITADAVNIIGNSSVRRGIIFGEGAGTAISDVTATVTNSTFTNMSRGVSDNESGQDAKSVTITGSSFTNAGINVSASEEIVITNNTFEDSIITVTSYTKDETEVDVTVNNNTLDIDSKINVRFDVAEEIAVTFKNPVKTEETATYDIVLVANDAETINRLNSVDLAFVLDNDDMIYEILATNEEVVINPVEENRYEFHYNGKTGVTTDTAKEIKIGSVKFSGYGEFTFKVDASVGTNVAHATKLIDNLVDTFVPGGSAEYGDLVLNDEALGGIIADEIVVPTRALEINVTFPNEVKEEYAANQNMTVTVSGGDLADAIVYNLGTDVAMNNGSYTMTTDLTKSIAYNVTVEGAGYRTARYTVTMNQDENETKTLNFWNNVKDNKVEVEEGKASSAVTKNFLAGDIVADNQINIYDLSAVVSYFATSTSADYEKYVKYDLNRDGVIDSKDVAYVLVSWME